jgi:hypothetical protein
LCQYNNARYYIKKGALALQNSIFIGSFAEFAMGHKIMDKMARDNHIKKQKELIF